MIKDIYFDMIQRLDPHDWAALFAVLSMLASPYLIIGFQTLVERIKGQINKRLAPHGLRLKERV